MRKAQDFGDKRSLLVFAEASLFHKDLDPLTVTELLKLEPDDSWVRGVVNSYGTPLDYGCWLISSKLHVASLNLGEHLGWLLDQLEERDDMLSRIKERLPGLKVFIMVRWNSLGFNTIPVLDEVSISRLARMKLGLDFLISFK